MKAFLKSKKTTIAAIAAIVIIITAAYIFNDLYGNPLAKSNAEKNIKAYIVDTYETTDFLLTEIEYNADYAEYCTTVTFKDSNDVVFDVSYSVKETRITDNYNSTVANGLNTFLRLSAEYGKRVINAISAYYTEETVMCYGELGKNQSISECGSKLVSDMEFDMYNLPLKSTISVFFERTDTSVNQFADDLIQLQKLMYDNEIAVVVENLENTDALAEYIKLFMQ